MTIADHPLHRSGLALLTHPALASSDNAHTVKRVRVMNPNRGKPLVEQDVHLLPVQFAPAATSAKRLIPKTSKTMPKPKQRAPVAGYTVVPVVAQDHGLKPLPLVFDRNVHPSSEFALQLVQFPGHP